MIRSSRYGIALAAFGTLVLTPDALFMRLSGMDGWQMLGWRGLCVGAVFWTAWALTTRAPGALRHIASPAGLLLILAQYANATLFPLGIAAAPVAVVLLGVATMPVWAALLSRVLLGEPTTRVTWAAIAAVLAGIALAVSGKGDLAVNRAALTGALCGLGVALSLATSFVTLRRAPELPLLPALGSGALLSGLTGALLTGPAMMFDGTLPAILVTGLLILPISFFALSSASRHTQAANVSLMMLLETVLGPFWVWLVLDEAPTARMLAGGGIVLVSLLLYILAPRGPEAARA
ncbi:DMT family transporter [Salipiger sp. P9]|uniref:DMT family transporter n=1 Tax=Salipiger pentaromativorans TaxID=2943193 RepID=UPI0021586AA9|nr:DMT family transporter [Salipiger pentaromativorans]MCR8547362.1 DMT family transporter [Salipiger pentaromativorans]